MAIFDKYLTSISNFIEESKRKNRQVRKLCIPSDLDSLNRFLQKNYSPAFNSNIVLKSETFLELGSPSTGSCAMTLYTNNTTILQDGEITLIGPDVGEAKGSELPFGQVIMAAGKEISDNDYHTLYRYINVSNLIQGYMVKSTSENIWSRISYKAAENGFNFKLLGASISKQIKTELPKVTSVNILFVTSNREDVLWLHQIGTEVMEIAKRIKDLAKTAGMKQIYLIGNRIMNDNQKKR